jgi:hypothetical protein
MIETTNIMVAVRNIKLYDTPDGNNPGTPLIEA